MGAGEDACDDTCELVRDKVDAEDRLGERGSIVVRVCDQSGLKVTGT